MTFEDLREKSPLFVETAHYLEKNSLFFRKTFEKLKNAEPDYEFAEEFCQAALKYAGNREEYFSRVHALIDFSMEFLKLQMHLTRTGKYTYSTFSEVEKHVYNNPDRELKGPWYLWALYFSQIFWVSHWRVLKFFLSDFAQGNKTRGTVLEAPTGTGVFIAKFLLFNPAWQGTGIDLSDSSTGFTRKVLAWNSVPESRITLHKQDMHQFGSMEKFDRIICGEFLEHVEDPLRTLRKLHSLLREDGRLFLTAAVYAEMVDHIYLYHSAEEVRDHIKQAGFEAENELVQPIFDNKFPEERDTPVNYCAILRKVRVD